MKIKIWCAISGHGFGHFAQVAPILNELAKQIPDLQLHITGNLPIELIGRMVKTPFTHDPTNRDVGLIQTDPLTPDLNATTHAMRQLHHDWPARIANEARLMTAYAPNLVLADVPYLSLAASHVAGIPAIAIASLTWDQILPAYFSLDNPEVQGWIENMQTAYAKTTLALLPTPALPVNPFPVSLAIPPITTLGQARQQELRQALAIFDQRPLILVTLGGIPANNLPIAAMAAETDFHWLVDCPLPASPNHIHPLQQVSHWPFADLTASVEGIISKPGYGMAISAAANQLPFLYVKRYTFADEPPICHWLTHHAQAMELTHEEFFQGQFAAPMQQLFIKPNPPPPDVSGAKVAAQILLNRFLSEP